MPKVFDAIDFLNNDQNKQIPNNDFFSEKNNKLILFNNSKKNYKADLVLACNNNNSINAHIHDLKKNILPKINNNINSYNTCTKNNDNISNIDNRNLNNENNIDNNKSFSLNSDYEKNLTNKDLNLSCENFNVKNIKEDFFSEVFKCDQNLNNNKIKINNQDFESECIIVNSNSNSNFNLPIKFIKNRLFGN